MSGTSDKAPVLRAALLAAALGGCLPGPWDYVPEAGVIFRGITVSAYAVADRPAEHVCFERLVPLGEASSEAFAFYDSAAVEISGIFSSGPQTVALAPRGNTPNCFLGPAGSRFLRGQGYALNARFVWDSAGVRAVTHLVATARIPTAFEIADTAFAPGVAQLGASLENVTDPQVFLRLPSRTRQRFQERYGDTLTALQGDSAGLALWRQANGERMRSDLFQWLRNDPITYRRGDSVFYLSAQSGLGNLSHFFRSRRDALVKGVLITHRFDTTGARPATAFDSLLGLAPDTASFYFAGDHRRLAFYGDFRRPDGGHVHDSLGVVNVWLWSGRNRLYFHGTERIYADYMSVLLEGGGSAKIRFPTNVSGGRGFFAGMVVDSFDVHVRLDSATQAVPYAVSRAAACRGKGWHETRDCVGYYPEHCAGNGWTSADCRLDAAYRLLDPLDSLVLPAALRDSARAWREADPFLRLEAARRYCIDRNYPPGVPECAAVRAECENSDAGNGCQLVLWKRCQLAYWSLPACAEGARSFCRARGDVHRTMCRAVAD